MVDRSLAFSILQLVALSLPAFAILLQMVVESEFAYTEHAVPITTASLGLFILAGLIILADLLVTTQSVVARIALGVLVVGMTGMLLGAGLIGLQTREAQEDIQTADD